MVLIKEDNTLRLGEIREVTDDAVDLQWYGTTWSRTRWKFYPGWETPDCGETVFVKSQSHGKPATCIVPKGQIIFCFARLTLQSTLPKAI